MPQEAPPSLSIEEQEVLKDLPQVALERLQDIKPGWAWQGGRHALTSLLKLYAMGPSSDTEAEALEEVESDEDVDMLRFDFDILEFLSFVMSSPDLRSEMVSDDVADKVQDFLDWVMAKAIAIKEERVKTRREGRVRFTVVEAQNSPAATKGWAGIFDLPAELIILILEQLCRDDLSFPWRFSHVSRLCRNIALDTPTLWSTIDFDMGVQRVDAQLERSMAAPLTVSTRFCGQDDPRLAALGGIFQNHAQRLRRLQVIFSSFRVAESAAPVLSLLAGQFPALEVLDLGFGAMYSRLTTNLFSLDDSSPVIAPALEHLSLRSCVIDSKCQSIPVGNLRSLTLVDVRTSLVALTDVLQSAQELESLRIEVFDRRTVSDWGVAVEVTLPKLCNAEFIHIGETQYLRSSIQAPAVQRLVYRPKADNSLWDQRRLLLQNSPDVLPEPNMPLSNLQTLRSLVLIDCPLGMEGWNTLFYSLPNLEDLCLSGCELTGMQLLSLSGVGSHTVLACPSLASLRVEEEFTLRSAAILGIVVARVNEGVSRIRRVELLKWLSSNLEDADIEAIVELVEECVVDVMDASEDDSKDGSTGSDTSEDSWYYEYEYEPSTSEDESEVVAELIAS